MDSSTAYYSLILAMETAGKGKLETNLIALPNTVISHLKFIVMTIGNNLLSVGHS